MFLLGGFGVALGYVVVFEHSGDVCEGFLVHFAGIMECEFHPFREDLAELCFEDFVDSEVAVDPVKGDFAGAGGGWVAEGKEEGDERGYTYPGGD